MSFCFLFVASFFDEKQNATKTSAVRLLLLDNLFASAEQRYISCSAFASLVDHKIHLVLGLPSIEVAFALHTQWPGFKSLCFQLFDIAGFVGSVLHRQV